MSEDGELRAVLAVVDEDNDPLTIWVEPRALDPSEVLLHEPYGGLVWLWRYIYHKDPEVLPDWAVLYPIVMS